MKFIKTKDMVSQQWQTFNFADNKILNLVVVRFDGKFQTNYVRLNSGYCTMPGGG
jgi:hypothetical protein